MIRPLKVNGGRHFNIENYGVNSSEYSKLVEAEKRKGDEECNFDMDFDFRRLTLRSAGFFSKRNQAILRKSSRGIR